MSGGAYAQAASQTIAAGTALYGGIKSRKLQEKLFKDNLDWQKDLARKGIQWKVRDAKAAGIHPLYAIGGQTYQGSPIPAFNDPLGPAIAEAGQNIGGAISNLVDRDARAETALRLQLLKSQVGESDARRDLLNSETARNNQLSAATVAGASPQLGVMQEGMSQSQKALGPPNPFLYEEPTFITESNIAPKGNKALERMQLQHPDLPGAGIIEKVPSEVQTHKRGNRGVVAGEHPAFKEYRLPNGLPIMLPAGDTLSEVLEETPIWMYKSIYEINKRKYGEQWGDYIWDFLWKGGTQRVRPSEGSRRKAREWLK